MSSVYTLSTDSCVISLVVPVYNEVESLEEFYGQATAACSALGRSYEIIFIDDGSDDGSAGLLDRLTERDPYVSVIHLRRNFGKSAALAAGFQYVRGRVVLTLDADLQDDPAMIAEFIERIDRGAELVAGWKKERLDPWTKTLPSRLFNATIRFMTGTSLHDINCGFKAYRIDCIKELSVYGGQHRFLPLIAAERGFRIEELVVRHRSRAHGRSKFGSKRLIEGFLDLFTVLLLTRYRTKPLHFFGIAGFGLGAIGIGILLYLSLLWLLHQPIGTRPLLTLGVLCTIAAIQFFAIGLMAELVVRTTIRSNEVFSIRDVRGRLREKSLSQTEGRSATVERPNG
jgi:glycosyltransferase involved in cell wall biosynthesis